MKYKFEDFDLEIENPTIEVDLKTIRDNAIDKLLSVDFYMIVNSVKFRKTAENMPYVDSWEDSEIEAMVVEWLTQYEI
jgi:hypothetical protein